MRKLFSVRKKCVKHFLNSYDSVTSSPDRNGNKQINVLISRCANVLIEQPIMSENDIFRFVGEKSR